MAAKKRSKSKPTLGLNVIKAGALTPAARLASEAKAPAGIRLTAQQADAATGALSDINLGAMAAFQLAMDAVNCPERAEVYLIGIQNIAKVVCRKADVLAALMGAYPGFGIFAEEFAVAERVR